MCFISSTPHRYGQTPVCEKAVNKSASCAKRLKTDEYKAPDTEKPVTLKRKPSALPDFCFNQHSDASRSKHFKPTPSSCTNSPSNSTSLTASLGSNTFTWNFSRLLSLPVPCRSFSKGSGSGLRKNRRFETEYAYEVPTRAKPYYGPAITIPASQTTSTRNHFF